MDATAPTPRIWGSRELAVAFGLVALTAAVFFPVVDHQFVELDDPSYVYENPYVTRGVTLEGVHWAFTTGFFGVWHPLTWVSLMLDSQIHGGAPGGFHLTNLLLHVATVLLLFAALRLATGEVWPSAAVAAAFAIHPLHVQSVCWIGERKGVLSSFFGVLALWSYVRYAQRPTRLWYAATMVIYALCLLSKPMWVTFPGMLLLLDFWPLGRIDAGWASFLRPPATAAVPAGANPTRSLAWLLLEKIPFVALSAAHAVITYLALQGGKGVGNEMFPMGRRFGHALATYVVYLRDAIWPSGLAIFYPNLPETPDEIVGAVVVLLAITGLVAWLARSAPYVAFGWLWYLGTLVPVIGFVQIQMHGRCDRYTDIPLIGVYIAVAWSVARRTPAFPQRSWAIGALAAGVIGALAWRSSVEAMYWRDDEPLMRRATQVTKDNWVAHNGLGLALAKRGDHAGAVREYGEALRIQSALKMQPDIPALLNLGSSYVALGRHDDALAALSQAESLSQSFQEAQSEGSRQVQASKIKTALGAVLGQQGQVEAGAAKIREAIELWPENADAHSKLAILLDRQGDLDGSLAEHQRAIELSPRSSMYAYDLGLTLAQHGRLAEAMAWFAKAIEYDPRNARAHDNLGVALIQQGQYPAAIARFRAAVEIDPKNPVFQQHLAESIRLSGGAAP